MGQHLTIAILFLLMTSPFLLSGGQEAYAQSSLNVTASQPCFLNYTANGLEMMQQCGLDDDYLRATTVGFDWVTGGLWPLIVVTILIVMTYLKYQNGIYPLAIGIVFLPIAGAFFPAQFISYAVVIGAVIGVGALVTMFIKKTTDYG
jgi:hypothetical protein